MRIYQLITGNRGLWEHLTSTPMVFANWRLACEVDEDGKVPENEVRLLTPEGTVLATLKLGPRTLHDVTANIQRDMTGRDMSSNAQPRPAWMNRLKRYHGTTGDEAAAKILRHQQTEDWYLEIAHHERMATDHIQLLEGGRPFADVWIEPRETLRDRVIAAVTEHHTGQQVAAGADPVPLKTAPADAAAAARAARQVGRALADDGRPAQEPGREETFELIPVDQIVMGKNQRSHYNHEKLQELAESIKARKGVIEPIIVSRRNGTLVLVAGARRLLASRMAQMPTIKAIVRDGTDLDDEADQLIENVQREELNPMDEAGAYQRLLALLGTPERVADQVGKSRPHVAEYLQLLALPADLQHQVATKIIGVKTALDYLRKTRNVPDQVRAKVARAITTEKPSIRKAPEVIDRVLQQEGVARATPAGPETSAATKQVVSSTPAAQPSTVSPATSTPVPRVDPHVERARALAEIGRGLWKVAPSVADDLLFARESYLPLDRVLRHWNLRRDIGATSMPADLGSLKVDIPEQGVWINEGPASHGVTLKDTKLTIGNSHGGVTALYTGNPVYYRQELRKGAGGTKSLTQQLVIQDGGRHVVVWGSYNVLMRGELVPMWADLVNELPGLPGGEGDAK